MYETIKQLRLEEVLGLPQAWADRVLAMIVARVVHPGSKRSAAGWWRRTSLPELLPGAEVSVQVLYEAMDALLLRQPVIERELAGRHLGHGRLVLYDVTSSYLEGRSCPLEVVVVGDRGMITRLHRSTLERHGYGWITALRASQIRNLRKQGLVQLS